MNSGYGARFGRVMAAVALAALLCSGRALAGAEGEPVEPVHETEGGPFGLGVFLGEPVGPTFELWLSDSNALQLTTAWSFDTPGFDLLLDYCFHIWDFFPNKVSDVVRFNIYPGLGGGVTIFEKHDETKVRVAMRFPLGFAARFVDYPFEVFAEVAPGLRLYEKTTFDIWGGVGARFFF